MTTPPPALMDAAGFAAFLEGGAIALAGNLEAVNALNVFPVPDGDTGTNMLLTLQEVVKAVQPAAEAPLSDAAAAAAHAALMNARGNSGVILSQFIRGVAERLREAAADADQLADAFASGAAATYRAVSNPVEGTMLTVMWRTAETMKAPSAPANPVDRLAEGLAACQEAVQQTREQLPVLRDAGVVDAGGQGFAVMLEGGLLALRGEDPASVQMEAVEGLGVVTDQFLEAVEDEVYGYCTQFVISGDGLDPEALRVTIDAMARSTVVIGDASTVRVHAHTLEPETLLDLGRAHGVVDHIKVESMDTQHQDFRAAHAGGPPAPVGIVAVAHGEGIERVLRSLGAGVIVSGGQTMNPSTEEILQGIGALNAEAAIILPNNKNIIASAQQAADLASIPVRVAPTTSPQQGIASLLAFSPTADLDANADAMMEGAGAVVGGEVVTAVRDAVVDGTPVQAGAVMALLQGDLVGAPPTAAEALAALLARAAPGDDALITLYWGGDVSHGDALLAAEAAQAAHPGAEVEVVHGGQPHYHYLVSIE